MRWPRRFTHGSLSWLLALLAGMVVVVFYEPLFVGGTLFSSPDGFPNFPTSQGMDFLRCLDGGWMPRMLGAARRISYLHPSILLMLLPPPIWHLWSYIANIVLAGVAWFIFLRGRGYRGAASIAPAALLGFSGYNFSLISAGHRAIFSVMPCVVFAFAFMDRALRTNRLIHYASLGAFIGMGLASQADVTVMFCLLLGVFSLMELIVKLRRLSGRERGMELGRVACGLVVAIVFLLCVSYTTVSWLQHEKVPGRKSIAGRTAEEKWTFATNWSMPPGEILEFVVPCLFGVETTDQVYPYWGKLGRTSGWEEHRQGLRNFKQHNLYMGAGQMVLGLFAVASLLWACFCRTRDNPRNMSSGVSQDAFAAVRFPDSSVVVRDTAFWSCAFLTTVLLAMGRYFPLYRVFYSLPFPYLRQIRCPVKIIHLSELCVAALFAVGLSEFTKVIRFSGERSSLGQPGKKETLSEASARDGTFVLGAGIVIAVMACLALAVAAVLPDCAAGLAEYWRELGYGGLETRLMQGMVGAFRHAGLLLLLLSAVFLLARFCSRQRSIRISLPLVLVIIIAADMAIVARKYVKVRDMSVFSAPNPLVEAIQSDGKLWRTSFNISQRDKRHPVWGNFYHHSLDILEPPTLETSLPVDYQKYFSAVGRNYARLWQLTSTRYILLPSRQAEDMTESSTLLQRGPRFDFTRSGVVLTESPQARFTTLIFDGALPRAQVYYSWAVASRETVLGQLTDQTWDPARSVLVSGEIDPRESITLPSQVRIVTHNIDRVVIDASTVADGVLVLNDKYDDRWSVYVDGEERELLVCNYIMRGVRLGPGEHRVEFIYAPHRASAIVSVIAVVLLVVWGVGLWFVKCFRVIG